MSTKANVVTVLPVLLNGQPTDEIIRVNANKPEFGYLMVESVQPVFRDGFLNLNRRVALVSARVSDLEQYISENNLGAGSAIPGKIVVKESLDQLSIYPKATDSELGIKYRNAAAKVAGLAYTVDNTPIYRKAIFTEDLSATDTLVQHDNQEDIQAFLDEQAAIAAKPKAGTVPKPATTK